MYEKYTPVRQQALFAPFIQISAFYSFLFWGRGVAPRYFAICIVSPAMNPRKT